MEAFETGKLGEYICAARLLRLGVSCEIINLDTIDILANVKSQLIRIQVKASSLKRHARGRSLGYQFFPTFGGQRMILTKEHCDVMAYVAVDVGRVIFEPVEKIEGRLSRRFLSHNFQDDDLEKKTWSDAMKYLDLSFGHRHVAPNG